MTEFPTFPVYNLSCDKCGKFVGKYAVNGEDHLMGFRCAECIQQGDKK